MLILGRQDRWQLTVKINLCSCLAPSEGCPRVSRIRGQPSVSLDAAAPQRSPPRYQDTDFLHRGNHASRVRVCNTVVAVTESAVFTARVVLSLVPLQGVVSVLLAGDKLPT